MDELNNKLNSGNPIIIAQIISKLIKTIKDRKDDDILELPEYKFLRDKSISLNNTVNVVAAEGILQIARSSDSATIQSILTDFIPIIITTKCSANVTYLINNLLVSDLSNSSRFNLRLPQHPFIILLKENANCWPQIYREISFSYGSSDSSTISDYDALYKPIFLYTLCKPEGNEFVAFRQKLWSFLLQKSLICNNHSIESILNWMQFENSDTLQLNSDFLIELATLNSQKEIFDFDSLIFLQTTTLYQLIRNNLDPRSIISSLVNSVKQTQNENLLIPNLVILSKCVQICPAIYLLQLLKLCKLMIFTSELDAITKNIFISSLLPWVTNSVDLIKEAISFANNLFSHLENKKTHERHLGFSEFHKLANLNSETFLSLQFYILLENWKNENDIVIWLDKLKEAPDFLISRINRFLIGLFLTEFEQTEIALKSLDLILQTSEKNSILTVLLYKLSNATSSELHLKILKALPQMATNRDNYQKVVNTILALSKGKNCLKTFSLSLMFDLWRIDNKSYHFLEKFLVEKCEEGNKWEFYVTIAHTLKELCALKPELYGKEIVAHLSRILNECNNEDGAVASALAIEGITYLCKSEIIDIVTTWENLEPLFKTETRLPVIKQLCQLISEIPTLSYSDSYPKLIEEVLGKLWEYLQVNHNDEVWEAALEALTHFELEQIVSQTPEDFLDEENLKLRVAGQQVPGNCWIHFMKNSSQSKLQLIGDFLIKLVSLEISNYLKFVYQVKGTREPLDYSYLPVTSVVRGIASYIKQKILKWKNDLYKEIYLECLRVFSQEYNKPLPPLDWCFLQELFHETETKKFAVNIAAHQVVLSGTARRFMVNYIEALSQNYEKEDVSLVYQNLKYLANSVQPFTMKPFLEKTILEAVDDFKEGRQEILIEILSQIKVTLINENILEANKFEIAEILSAVFLEIEISEKLFEVLLDCVVLFPPKAVEDLTSLKENSDWLKKAIKVKCHLAKSATLNHLNDLVETGSDFEELKNFIFEEFASVFRKHQSSTECVLWLLELIGQIQAATAERSSSRRISFLCDIFILAVVIFSGFFVFESGKLEELFPRAVAVLLDVNHWSICTNQALELFHHMIVEKILPNKIQLFIDCLRSLRHENEFYKNMRWTKYLNVEN